VKALACRPGSHLDCHTNMSSEEEQNALLEATGSRPGRVPIHPWGMFGTSIQRGRRRAEERTIHRMPEGHQTSLAGGEGVAFQVQRIRTTPWW